MWTGFLQRALTQAFHSVTETMVLQKAAYGTAFGDKDQTRVMSSRLQTTPDTANLPSSPPGSWLIV